MTLNEVLLEENEGGIFKCIDNVCVVRNDKGTLLYLNKKFDDGTQNWKNAIMTKVWLNATYKKVKLIHNSVLKQKEVF